MSNKKQESNTKLKLINYVVIGLALLACVFVTILVFCKPNVSKIYDKNIMKVVEIKISDDETTWGYATGCFVDNKGLILTNKHVVYNNTTMQNYTIIQARLADSEEWISATVIKVSDTDDLALIKIEKQNTSYFKIKKDVKNGEEIYTIGNPNGFGLSFTTGVVSSNYRKILYNGQTINTIQTSLVINEGNSGGPVFSNDGKLVGLVSFRLKDRNSDIIQGVSFAIPASEIKDFIK